MAVAPRVVLSFQLRVAFPCAARPAIGRVADSTEIIGAVLALVALAKPVCTMSLGILYT